jgi:hypothetical protein
MHCAIRLTQYGTAYAAREPMSKNLHSETSDTQDKTRELELAHGHGEDPIDEDDRPTLTFIDAAKLNEELSPLTPPAPS